MANVSDAVPNEPSVLRDRQLAAVVFTDVVGYSAMMHADEAATIPRIRTDLDRMRAMCKERGGECLNSMGDGLMLAFTSAVEALAFALEMQEEFAVRNESGGTAPSIQHRIGIHVGDVFRTDDGSLAGDGVNIAARLEGNAPPGGICISQSVYDMVKGKLPLQASYAGAKQFKNIAEPISVWHLHPRGAIAPVEAAKKVRQWRRRSVLAGGVAGAAAVMGAGAYLLQRGVAGAPASGPQSLAVLPFTNLSDDKDAGYFADGIHEDLLTQLALLGGLKVVSRTSVMEYRNTTKKMAQIGSELKVAALVEGSVRKAGNTVRVTAQLVDAQADKHIWAANYDRDLRDIFKVQSELAKEIAGSLNVSLTAAEEKRLDRAPTQNLQAYELYLRQQQMKSDVAGSYRTITSVKDRIALLQKAVDLDPKFAIAWAKLGAEHARARGFGLVDDRENEVKLAREAIARAKLLAPDDPQIKIEEAAVYLHGLDDQAKAKHLYEEVLATAPYNLDALLGVSEINNELMLDEEDIQLLERALTVEPRNGSIITRLSNGYARYRRYDRALALRHKLVELHPDSLDLQAASAWWAYRATGRWDEYDHWRPTVPEDATRRHARVVNVDVAHATALGDFAELHRLFDLPDAADWPRELRRKHEADGEELANHVFAWHAAGETARAKALARRTLATAELALEDNAMSQNAWALKASMHALLGQRESALDAFDKSVEFEGRSGNQWGVEYRRRDWPEVLALLGDSDSAVEALRAQSKLVGFGIYDKRTTLALASIWKHPGFVQLIADPATHAPLPYGAPKRYTIKR